MANNNGNIIGAAHSSYSGVWDTQDQYQQALAGNWPAAVVTYWEPDNAATAPVAWWKAKENLTSNIEMWSTGSDVWTDEISSKTLESGGVATGADLNPVWVQANEITSTSTEYGANDYTPLCFGDISNNGGTTETNQKAILDTSTSDLATDSNHVTVGMVIRKATQASGEVPLFLIGGDQNANKGTDTSGVGTMLACYLDGGNDSVYFNDNGNTIGLTAIAGSSDWNTNSEYYIFIVRAKLSAGDSYVNTFIGGANTGGSTPSSQTTSDNSNDGSGSHFELSSNDADHGFAIGKLNSIRGSSADTISMSSSSDIRVLETVIYSHNVSDADIQKLEGYFYHKFKGDTESPSLASGHTYLTSAPTV